MARIFTTWPSPPPSRVGVALGGRPAASGPSLLYRPVGHATRYAGGIARRLRMSASWTPQQRRASRLLLARARVAVLKRTGPVYELRTESRMVREPRMQDHAERLHRLNLRATGCGRPGGGCARYSPASQRYCITRPRLAVRSRYTRAYYVPGRTTAALLFESASPRRAPAPVPPGDWPDTRDYRCHTGCSVRATSPRQETGQGTYEARRRPTAARAPRRRNREGRKQLEHRVHQFGVSS